MGEIDALIGRVYMAKDESLLMSRSHCHARNVSSIVLRQRIDGSLLRAFLAWPCHRLADNRPGGLLQVGVHDHRYDVCLSLIHGDVENVTYKECDEGGHEVYEWMFSSGVSSGTPIASLVGRRRIRESGREPLPMRGIVMGEDTLHDIECRGVCGWYVDEGVQMKSHTRLLTESEELKCDGLYVPFESREHVVGHVLEWASLAVKEQK